MVKRIQAGSPPALRTGVKIGTVGLDLFVVDVSVGSFCSMYINQRVREGGKRKCLICCGTRLIKKCACSKCSISFFELEHCKVKVKRVRHGLGCVCKLLFYLFN